MPTVGLNELREILEALKQVLPTAKKALHVEAFALKLAIATGTDFWQAPNKTEPFSGVLSYAPVTMTKDELVTGRDDRRMEGERAFTIDRDGMRALFMGGGVPTPRRALEFFVAVIFQTEEEAGQAIAAVLAEAQQGQQQHQQLTLLPPQQ